MFRFGRAGHNAWMAALGARRHLYVRELEWEAAHTVLDLGGSLAVNGVRLALVRDTKLYRALVVALASPNLVEAATLAFPGLMRPTGSCNIIDRMAQAIVHDCSERGNLPPNF